MLQLLLRSSAISSSTFLSSLPSSAPSYRFCAALLYSVFLCAVFLSIIFLLLDCCVCLTILHEGLLCAAFLCIPLLMFDWCVCGTGVKMPINHITTMLLVCQQAANLVIAETHVGKSLCAHRDVFSVRLGVMLGRWEDCGSGGDDTIWP